MESQTQADRDESCFGRAARAIRRALARICGGSPCSPCPPYSTRALMDSENCSFSPPFPFPPFPSPPSPSPSAPTVDDGYTLEALGGCCPKSSTPPGSPGIYAGSMGASIWSKNLPPSEGQPVKCSMKRLSWIPEFSVRKKHKHDSIDSPDFKLSIHPASGSVLKGEVSTSRVGQEETLRKYTARPANLQHATYNDDMSSSSIDEQVESSDIVRSFRCNVSSCPGLVETDSAVTATHEEFTPDENDEDYRFLCSSPGMYECSVTGLVFHMEGEGDVVYRTVPWDRQLLAQHHKKPAGPLFDIKCVQQSLCQLYIPHCEISSTGGSNFLSVAHVKDEGVEFISPHVVTESHVVINITGFSGYGNVKDEDSPPDPVRALVLLFYRPPADPDPESFLNVLLLPKNVVLRDVQRIRKKSVGDEIYLETSPHCKLHPGQEYTLSTSPEDNSVLVQPKVAEFDCDDYDNFFPSFQVNWETKIKYMKLILKDTNSSNSVWERQVCLLSKGVKRAGAASALNLPPNKRLQGIRSGFIDGISGPVLKSLLDKLFEKTVITEAERESAQEMQNKRDKARFVIDTVRRKGEAASLEMIDFLCEADPFLCEHLDLI